MLYFTFGILFISIGFFMIIIFSTDYFDNDDDFDVDGAKQTIGTFAGILILIAGTFLLCESYNIQNKDKVEECKRSCEQIDE